MNEIRMLDEDHGIPVFDQGNEWLLRLPWGNSSDKYWLSGTVSTHSRAER
jgi:hypothetical protein